MSYDNTCKFLAEEYPTDFVRWLLGMETEDINVLKTELFLEPIRADSVTFLQTKNRILHIEFQTEPTSKPPIPFRMGDYSFRLKRKYKCPVTQVVIFLQETTNEIAFTEEYRDETTIHRYRVIRLWEQDSAFFLNNRGLLPLAPLTKTDSPSGFATSTGQKLTPPSGLTHSITKPSCSNSSYNFRYKRTTKHNWVFRDFSWFTI